MVVWGPELSEGLDNTGRLVWLLRIVLSAFSSAVMKLVTQGRALPHKQVALTRGTCVFYTWKSLWSWSLLLFHSRWGRLLSTIGAITHCRCKVGEWKTEHNLASFSLRESMPVFFKQGAMELLKGAPGDASCLASKDKASHLPKQAAHLACCYCLEEKWFILCGSTLGIFKKLIM